MQTVTAFHTAPILGAPKRLGPAATGAFANLGRQVLGQPLVSAA